MSQFRSEEMNYVQMFIQNDAAHATLHELGAIGAIQFKDLNKDKSAFQKMFVQDVRKCEDMLRIIRYLKSEMETEKMPSRSSGVVPKLSSLNELHERLQELEKEMKEHGVSYKQLLQQRKELAEHLQVLRNASKWFGQANRTGVSFTAPTTGADEEGGRVEMSPLLEEGDAQSRRPPSMLGHIAGCIPTLNVRDFAVTLFRTTRGNMHLKHQELEMDDENEMKSVFIVYFSGERSRQKIEKICEAFGATKYSLPDNAAAQERTQQEVRQRMKDVEIVVAQTEAYRRQKLSSVADYVQEWEEQVEREKGVCHTLNKFNYDVSMKALIAEGWCAVSAMDDVRRALRAGTLKSGASVQTVLNVVKTRDAPPTYFKSNKMTAGFQAIVDAYGMARYQEFNPAVFTFITFPFLFGVMFGDIGHGFLMTMAGGLICLFEKQLKAAAANDMFGTIYDGRYNIFLMGLFATYSGFIYNELFSVPMEALGTTAWCSGEMDDPACLAVPGINASTSLQKWLRTNINEAYDFTTQQSTGVEVTWDVYPMGADPGWAHTANKLNSANSFKMKFAIVIGVTQMVAGVCCKLMNSLYFKDMLTLYFVYIPEMVFINSIFGYLVILILVKWTTNWDATYILNNEEVVHIPQVYCKDDLSNVPCWTAPFVGTRGALPIYNTQLEALPAHMWCMQAGVPTTGCAVFEWKGKMIVESNTYGNNSFVKPELYNAALCEQSAEHCMLYKQSPPSLLDTLIKMFMEPGTVDINNQLIAGQGALQGFLILIAFVSVPTLLFPKPLLLKAKHQARRPQGGQYGTVEEMPILAADDGHSQTSDAGHHGEEFDFGEEMVHQMIHTIEYVLGCISNTASYLRLWALSLAHAQLSEVFWEKTVVEIGLTSASPLMLFVTITAWSCFTFGVLMGMESLSAFLHALRLHWVEFMNKFYHGDGYKFTPFAFDTLKDDSD